MERGMKMDPFMKRAVELAAQNVREGGQPFGAVLVKNREIIAEGVNELHLTYDVSGHAELLAIRRAQASLGTHDLEGFTMYASGSPCPMCLTAMYFSGIKDIYYCASVEEAAEAGLGVSKHIYADLAKPNGERSVVMKHLPLEKGLENPMTLWQEGQRNE
jgi:tRNA(Arg) A34 adenosine deaminase TadA